MTQSRSHSFHDPITARGSNTRFRLLPAGIYAGYYPRPNPVDASKIDLIRGNDGESVALTVEGVTVREDNDLSAVVQPAAADKTFPRIDLLVIEYQYTTNTAVEAVYKLIKGVAADPSVVVAPVTQNAFQIPIATVTVPANSQSKVILGDTDLRRVARASDTEQSELASLRPYIDSNNSLRLYVQPGAFQDATQTQLIRFEGGFTPSIDTSLIATNSTLVFIFGVDDSGELVVVDSVASFDDIPNANPTTFFLAAVRYRKSNTNVVTPEELLDLRVPIGRLGTGEDELDSWTDLLGESAFTNMVVELFNTETIIFDPTDPSRQFGDVQIDLDPTDPENENIVLTIDRSDSSLVVDVTGATSVAGGVTLKLNNILSGAFVVNNFSFYADSDADVSFTYSTTSAAQDASFTTSPKVSSPLSGADVLSSSNAPFSNFYPRLHISEAAFTAFSGVVKIRGVGLLANLESAAATKLIAASDAFSNAELNVHNLIGNPFLVWSRPDVSGDIPDLLQVADIAYELSSDPTTFDAYEAQFGPDGWTRSDVTPGITGIARRINGTSPFIPAMEIGSLSGSGPLTVEYRIPLGAHYRGNQVTFSVGVSSPDWSPGGVAGIDIAIYNETSRINSPLLVSVASTAENQRLLVTSASIPDSAISIGFQLVIDGTPGSNIGNTLFSSPMAAWGKFSNLPFSPSRDAFTYSAQHYEIGRLTFGGYAVSGTRVQASHAVTRKNVELGSIRTRIVPDQNFSENLSTITIANDAFNKNRINVSGVVEQTGRYLIDIVYEAAVLPTRL